MNVCVLDRRIPPNGAFMAMPLVAWLIFTSPDLTSRAKAVAIAMSPVTMPADRPNELLLTTSTASSYELTVRNARIGANTSSCASRLSGSTPVKIAGPHEVAALGSAAELRRLQTPRPAGPIVEVGLVLLELGARSPAGPS